MPERVCGIVGRTYMSDIYATRPFSPPIMGRIYAAPTLPSTRWYPFAVIPALQGFFNNPLKGGVNFLTSKSATTSKGE